MSVNKIEAQMKSNIKIKQSMLTKKNPAITFFYSSIFFFISSYELCNYELFFYK